MKINFMEITNLSLYGDPQIFYIIYICGIIVQSNNVIWQFVLKWYWRCFNLAVLSTVWKQIHTYSLNGVHLI